MRPLCSDFEISSGIARGSVSLVREQPNPPVMESNSGHSEKGRGTGLKEEGQPSEEERSAA